MARNDSPHMVRALKLIRYGGLSEPIGFEIGPYVTAVVRASTAGLVCIAVFGCAQTVSYAPSPITATYKLDNFSRAALQIIVRDLRAERTGSVELISAIQSQISNALPESKALHSRYTLTVDVIEHRSFFTMGNWNASTRLKWRVQQGSGSIIREGVADGEGQRSNMAGYVTAGAVSQDAFNVAMADLMSSLSAVPTG